MKTKKSSHDDIQQDILKERKKRIFSKKGLIFLFLSLVILYFLVININLPQARSTLNKADLTLIPIAFILYSLSNFFKTLRFRVFFKEHNINLKTLFTIVCYHNFFNLILPARTGELTLVYYLNKIARIDITKGIHSLLLVRIYDLIIVSFFFLGSLIIYFGMKSSPMLLLLGIIVSIISIVLIFKLASIINFFNKLIYKLIRSLQIENHATVRKLYTKIEDLINEFNEFDIKGSIPLLSITSILIWSSLYLLSFTTIKIFTLPISFLQSIIGSTGAVLTNVLPINTFGSFGTLEAGWTGGFVLIGMSTSDAIITGFGYHIFALIFSSILAIVFFLSYKISQKK